MIYVFDSSPLIDLFRHYYPTRFPSLWESFNSLVTEERIISVKEVRNEIEGGGDRLADWVKENRETFTMPTNEELVIVSDIFKVGHFQAMIRRKERLQGKPVADPFVIAKASVLENGCVVTLETYKENAAKIPNVCEHFGIPWLNLEDFMEKENWSF